MGEDLGRALERERRRLDAEFVAKARELRESYEAGIDRAERLRRLRRFERVRRITELAEPPERG